MLFCVFCFQGWVKQEETCWSCNPCFCKKGKICCYTSEDRSFSRNSHESLQYHISFNASLSVFYIFLIMVKSGLGHFISLSSSDYSSLQLQMVRRVVTQQHHTHQSRQGKLLQRVQSLVVNSLADLVAGTYLQPLKIISKFDWVGFFTKSLHITMKQVLRVWGWSRISQEGQA